MEHALTRSFLKMPALMASLGLMGVAACTAPMTPTDHLPEDPSVRAATVAQIKEDIDAMEGAGHGAPARTVAGNTAVSTGGGDMATPAPVVVAEPAMITAIGFAQVSGQPGRTLNEKRLLALRAARVDAIRILTEQVHGIYVTSTTTVSQARVGNDSMSAMVEGTIRGARTVRITPKGTDGYEVELALDASTVAYIVSAFRGAL